MNTLARRLTLLVVLAVILAGVAAAAVASRRPSPAVLASLRYRVDHFVAREGWDSMCDVLDETGDRRCYLRFVDVYSPRPDFGAAMLFLTPTLGGARIELSFEPGTAPDAESLVVMMEDESVAARLPAGACEANRCIVAGRDGVELAGAMARGRSFLLAFTDRGGTAWKREWPLGPAFALTYADFRAAARARGLF